MCAMKIVSEIQSFLFFCCNLKVPIIENSVCQEMFAAGGHTKKILQSFLCAGYANGQKDSTFLSFMSVFIALIFSFFFIFFPSFSSFSSSLSSSSLGCEVSELDDFHRLRLLLFLNVV